MSVRRDLVRQLQRPGRQSRATHLVGTVVASDVLAGTAMVEMTDSGVEVEVAAEAGYLPQPGSTVKVVLNGAEPVVFAPQQMVDGDMRSRTYVAGEQGWIIEADGDAEFNNVTVRGSVIATELRAEPRDVAVPDGDMEATVPADQAWEAYGDCAVTYGHSAPAHGAQDLAIERTASGSNGGARTKATHLVPITGGRAYALRWFGYSSVVSGVSVQPVFEWFTEAGASLGTSTADYPQPVTFGYTTLRSKPVTAPDDAAQARIKFGVIGASGTVYSLDDVVIEMVPYITGAYIVGANIATDDRGNKRGVLRQEQMTGGGLGTARLVFENPTYYLDQAAWIGMRPGPDNSWTDTIEMVGMRTSGSVTDVSTVSIDDQGHITLYASPDLTAEVRLEADEIILGSASTDGRIYAQLAPDATAPAYTFDADRNTGMYRRNADELAFATAGLRRMMIEADGDVNITQAVTANRAFIPGMITGTGTTVVWNATFGELVRNTSSKRYKTAIRGAPADLAAAVLALRPVTFKYRAAVLGEGDDHTVRHLGLVAEEAAEVLPAVVVTDPDGRPDALDVQALTVAVVAAVQSIDARLRTLEG